VVLIRVALDHLALGAEADGWRIAALLLLGVLAVDLDELPRPEIARSRPARGAASSAVRPTKTLSGAELDMAIRTSDLPAR
jgi:hypothetical protein